MQPLFNSLKLAATICLALMIGALVAHAQESTTQASFAQTGKENLPINVLIGQSRVITFDRAIERFSISNPEIAEAVLVSKDQVIVNGKGFGQVNFIAWEKGGERMLIFDVYVRTNLSLIDSQVRALFPKDDIRLSQANGSVVLSGSVADENLAKQAEAVVQAAGFKTVNMLQTPPKNMLQVQLQVRVAEVSRSRIRDIGAAYGYQSSLGVGGFLNSGGGPYSVGKVDGGEIFGTVASSALNLFVMGGNSYNFLRALQTQGAIRSLAEPNLIAMNGQTASFLAGGEFPVPIVQNSGDRVAVAIVFKEYGIRLNFKPTIIDEEHIRLEMEPEVSTIDFANGVKFDGFLIPALKTRRAKTGVELRDGQSFALAGLLDNNEVRSMSKVPLLGDVPLLGNLFRSKSFQKQETELMFFVTAQMVKPVNRDDLPQIRGVDGLKGASPLGVEPKGEGIEGQSGHIIDKNSAPTVAPKAPAPTAPATTNGSGAQTAPTTKAAPAATAPAQAAKSGN